MFEQVEITYIDEEGIVLRSYARVETFYYDGDPMEIDSPLIRAFAEYYQNDAPQTLLYLGYETPRGTLNWESEITSLDGDEGYVEIGERLFLTMEQGERWLDEFAYETLADGQIPEGWVPVPRV